MGPSLLALTYTHILLGGDSLASCKALNAGYMLMTSELTTIPPLTWLSHALGWGQLQLSVTQVENRHTLLS